LHIMVNTIVLGLGSDEVLEKKMPRYVWYYLGIASLITAAAGFLLRTMERCDCGARIRMTQAAVGFLTGYLFNIFWSFAFGSLRGLGTVKVGGVESKLYVGDICYPFFLLSVGAAILARKQLRIPRNGATNTNGVSMSPIVGGAASASLVSSEEPSSRSDMARCFGLCDDRYTHWQTAVGILGYQVCMALAFQELFDKSLEAAHVESLGLRYLLAACLTSLAFLLCSVAACVRSSGSEDVVHASEMSGHCPNISANGP